MMVALCVRMQDCMHVHVCGSVVRSHDANEIGDIMLSRINFMQVQLAYSEVPMVHSEYQ